MSQYGCTINQDKNPKKSPIPTNGLVAWYPFNGNAKDESDNENNGIVNGATLTTDRFKENTKAYSFTGANCATRIDTEVRTNILLD